MQTSDLDKELLWLKRNRFAEYGYGEVLIVWSFKQIQITSDCIKLYICQHCDKIIVNTYNIDGDYLDTEIMYYGKQDFTNIEGESATDFESRDVR
jgi:hypothetical protein